jgi:hypothetical protein
VLAWLARERWGQRLEVLGVDRDVDVIAAGRRRAAVAGLDDVVRFAVAPLAGLDLAATWAEAFVREPDRPAAEAFVREPDRPAAAAVVREPDSSRADGPRAGEPAVRIDAVVALHACDTATCDAIALGVAAGAELIAVAPCCQAELARAWSELAAAGAAGAFAPIWSMPHLRRELAAELTDAMRTLLLRAAGYDVAAIEFVPSPHTRKNTLIRALRRRATEGAADDAADGVTGGAARGPIGAEARDAHDALVAATGGRALALASRLVR